MRRREFLRSFMFTATALSCKSALGVFASEPQRKKQGYNVLFICLDDLNDWVGCLGGHPDVKTPNIDKLAKSGTLFTRAYCSSPICGPSRTAFLSGMRASTTGLYDNTKQYEDFDTLTEAQNLPQFFRNNGHHTMGAGKIFHGYYPEYWNDSLERGPRMYQAGEPKRNGTDIPGIFDWGPLDVEDNQMDDYRMAQYAIDKINQKQEKSFFLACGIYLPHVPWYAPKKYFDMYPLEKITMPVVKENDLDDISKAGQTTINLKYSKIVEKTGKQREAVQAYLACISFADAQAGRIIDALDSSPYRDNTIVVLCGDNGLHQGQKRKWHKDSLWAEVARIPLIIRVPGMPSGIQCEKCVSLLDLYPTLADLCGLKPPANLEGDSIVPLLKDPGGSWDRPAITNRRKDQTSVRTEKWCYIRYHDGSEELYEHQKDPYEWNNLASDPNYKKVKEGLSKYIPKNQKSS